MFRTIVTSAGLAVALAILPPAAPAQKAAPNAREKEAKLIATLNKADASRKAKADACRELAAVGTAEAVPPLAALLSSEELGHMARYGLEPIPDPAVDVALRDAMGKLKGNLLVGVIGSVGVRRDPKAVPALVQKLGDPDAEVAAAAARALGRIGNRDAAEALEKALGTMPAACRVNACEGLFRAADALRTQGQRREARAIYEKLASAEVPEYVKDAAKRAEQGLEQARGR
ncbi:PBS lyase HEAT-like repeat protein [Aquisphaera giovannonii]|uniref:PBS lyase HEAT-like repeat protein n=1 Tax=Aquisphaera giovannonii TaxID=406548 RepID=A0A5B9WCC1_9BACT|nr:HEAT repeat domain-containing protein [Aquisphaera giovannonii]QEH37695.1 PBS lyase HEAT-like repeat protein [Aquisphaera giovannonii]